MSATRALRFFLVAGETSGDHLGAALIAALRAKAPEAEFLGVGGPEMTEQGLASLFPMADIAVMGFLPVVKRLPLLLRRIEETARAVIEAEPDVLVIIDSPDFTHRVAKKVRAAKPGIRIVNYVSPTVWAWRPGRARKMRPYVDHLLALLPFEPAAHARLGGPPTSYVGHPLLDAAALLKPSREERDARANAAPTILILPGSRRSEVQRLMPVFGETVQRLAATFPEARFILPAVEHVRPLIEQALASWPVKPEIVSGGEAKFAAFRRARAALAASGTVTLELALAGVPMVVAYKVSALEEIIARRLVTVGTIVLPNLILGERVVPDFVQKDVTAERLASELLPLLADGPARQAQIDAFARLDQAMALAKGQSPAEAAAETVLQSLAQ